MIDNLWCKAMKSKADAKERDAILGTRIRQRRREMGVAQASLARDVGISPSYLNLIEWNKRRVAGALLTRIADALGLQIEELDGQTERRLVDTLAEVAHLPELGQLDIESERAGELIGRFPGWARAIATLARAERDASARAQTLSDRLSNDPFLREAVHRMLTRIAAVRSAAEILGDYPGIPAERRNRFVDIINEESRTLSDAGEALAAYLDQAEEANRILTPIDEVEALFMRHENRFEAIESATQRRATRLTPDEPVSRRARAREVAQKDIAPLIGELISARSEIQTAAAAGRARQALTDYAADALLLPMDVFAAQASRLRYDIEQLAEAFSIEIETIARRLTALPRDEGAPRFGYVRANAAGTIVEMRGLPDLALPRYAAACPLWVLYRAQQSPESVIRQRALFPSGARFVFAARARRSGPTGFGRPRHYVTDMVTMTEEDAAQTVYAPDVVAIVEEVGPSCRLCPRRACEHRVEDPLG